jgi:hypothetical protein
MFTAVPVFLARTMTHSDAGRRNPGGRGGLCMYRLRE